MNEGETGGCVDGNEVGVTDFARFGGDKSDDGMAEGFPTEDKDGSVELITDGLSDGTTGGKEELDEIGEDVGAPKKVGGSVGKLGIEVGDTVGVNLT